MSIPHSANLLLFIFTERCSLLDNISSRLDTLIVIFWLQADIVLKALDGLKGTRKKLGSVDANMQKLTLETLT